MTCMQMFLPRPFILPPSPNHASRHVCFALGPVHRVPRHWLALWICCHTSDDMLYECGPPAAAYWLTDEVVG